jgi:hypothetical protein
MKINFTEIETKTTDNIYYGITIKSQGFYIDEKNSKPIELTEKSTAFCLGNKTLEERTKEIVTSFYNELEEELILKNFIINIKEYGYSRLLALKEVIEQGFKLGFFYDFLGSATIERINNKSLTIEDITNRKHYIDLNYLNKLSMDQFFIAR